MASSYFSKKKMASYFSKKKKASSSSPSARRWEYDVFLSFRGSDTRKGITSDIYDRLNSSRIKTYMDDRRLQVGDVISDALVSAIKESRFAIVVLSQNYASSVWCLEELREICLSMEHNRIFPLFYDVDPTDVRHQKRSFEDAFSKYETSERHESEKVKQWRAALYKVANISGWNTNQYKTHKELVDDIVESLRRKIRRCESTGDFEEYEATRQATIDIEPTMSESNEDFEVVKVIRRAPIEIEPTMLKLTEDFEAVEAATEGSAEPAPQWNHDVFLSFRGVDTRKGFLSHLYHELQNTKVIRTFKDDEQLKKGKDISQSLLKAIEESRFAIVVLSENYAFSAWCLDELTKIFQCMEGKDTILPIFYDVDPSDVRYQKGQFEVAFTEHESKASYDKEKVKQWRADLRKVGNLSGWHSENHKSERELVEDIVKFVFNKVVQAPRGDFEEFEATREAMDEVKKMLKDDKIPAVGVYGRGGVGKTAMVEHVGAQAKRIGLFNHVVMAVISRNPDLQNIQGALVNQLGLELVEDEEIERASRLKERIMGGKRILIILDDIWEIIDLSSIGIPSYDELQRCNSKVLLTTRMRNICHSMGCQAHIPLNILSEEDSLKLFMKKSRKPFHGSTNSYDEERNVVRECAGLPSVLEEVAWAFGHKYVEEWNEAVSKAFGDDDDELQKAAQELNASQLVPTKDERDTFKRIELSYHTLWFDDAKSFFLLCCMFPEDYDIPIEDLFKYGIGKGLLQYSDTLQEARDRAHSLVAYLKALGLLLDGKKGCIRMHFDIRNVAMSIALSAGHAFFVKAGCELKDWPMDAHEGYSAISLMRNKLNKLPETLVCSELQMLLLQSNAGICDIPETFFQSPSALKVFDLSHTGISVLPSSFNLLTNLQALYLDCCNKITDISVLGKLKKVEILSLRKFPHKELPKEIGNLTSLRMLDVTGGCVHKIPSKVISRLYRLEELYMKCEFGDWGSQVEEAVGQTNADFDEIIGLSRLNILKVYISDAACLPKDIGYVEPNWVKFDICISRDLSLEMMLAPNDQPSRTLTLDRTINGLSDWFINVVTEKAEKLEYRECKGLKNILKEYEHGRLHGLKHLSVIGCHENLEELINATTWDPSKPVFESLEELHLLHLQRLKELCVGELPLGSLCNLKLLKVQTCCNLVNALLPPKLLQRLTNIETIFCINMEHMKYVFGSEALEPGTILLTKLSEMRLCALFNLISIWNGPAPHAVFCNLKVVAVCRCPKLKHLFSFDVAQFLVQLEDLSVESCPNLCRVIEASNSLNRYIVFLGLKKLALINLPELTWFCTKNGTVDTECPLLEYLYVDKCPQFTSSAFASASVKLNDQQHLNSLVKGHVSMLEYLYVDKCPQFTSSAFASASVKLNDQQHLNSLVKRTERQHIEAIAESVFGTLRHIETEFTMPMGDFQAFEATRQAMDKVMKALEADEVTAIGVYGTGGVGKTTMVEHVSAEVRDNGMFHHVISAVVSQNPDFRKIQGTLADMLGLIFEEETEIGRARRLMQRIRRGNRILIILDNIWERTDLSNIGIPSYYELQRCYSKVLLITRTQNVCRAMECQSNISLDVLSEEDSWTLFVNKARMCFESTNFCVVAKKVARACAGLPVALIAVAKALGDKCLDDWKEAARRLEASQPANLEDGKVVFNCIKLSYDYLISDDARSCFLLCCLFPEDYNIQIEELLKYGMGKGLFQDSCTMQDARATAHLVVKYLKDCSLLLETEQDGCVKMHDVIRDMAIRISLSEDGPLFFVQAGCQLKEWPSISAHEGYSAISLIRNKICKLPEELVCPKLLILFLQSNVCLNKIPEYFFQSLNVLRVLDLSRTRISFLPTSFSILINLQTLYLDGCLSTIDNISILGKLKKLEILSMRELPLVELPKEIGDLSHLRMLDITGDYVDNVPSEVICNLNSLEELYMQCNFAEWGSKVEGAGEDNIVAFDELTGLSYLNVLKVFISDAKCLPKDVEVEPNWVNFDICISRDPSIRKVSLVSSSSPAFIRALTLDTTVNALPGWFINAVTMKAEKLQYIMCWGLDNILVEFDCGRLHALKYLSVIGPNENLKVLMNTVTHFRNEPVFQNLEELHLVQVDCLKELCVGELPPGSLCNLRLLKVKHCYELVDALLPSRLLKRLQNLRELICEEIDELEYVFGCEGLEPKQLILTELIEMRLENLGKLIKIWNGPAHCAIFQNLQSLVVSRCFELENLFTADVAQCFFHLKDLSVELCPMLDNIIEASKDTVDNKIVFPELKNLTLIKLPQLTRFCGSTGSAIECPLLEYLYVERCPQFSTSDFHSRNKVEPKHPQHLDIVLRRARAEKRRKIKFTEVVQEDSK